MLRLDVLSIAMMLAIVIMVFVSVGMVIRVSTVKSKYV